MSPNNANIKEKRIYICPYCHKTRVIENENQYIHVVCYHCDSQMNYVCSKKEYMEKTKDEKEKIINDLKVLYPEVFTPSEILLKKLLQNIKVMNTNLCTIKNIMVFYLVLTLLGLFIAFVSHLH